MTGYPKNYTSTILLIIVVFLTISCSNKPSSSTMKQESNKREALDINSKMKPIDNLFYIEGQICQHLRIIFEDSAGNIWFGTNVFGLMRYNGEVLEYFNKENGYDFGRVTGIIQDKDGAIWIAGSTGLHKYEDGVFTNYTEGDGLLNNELWSLKLANNGKLWIGTNEGVCTFDGSTFSTFPIPFTDYKHPESIYSYTRIVDIEEDQNGNMWFGTDGQGLFKYDGKEFLTFTTEKGLNDDIISELFIDTKGVLWVGTYFGGLSSFDGNQFTNYTKNGLVKGNEVGSFFEDKDTNLWFAAENYGVYKYDRATDTFTNFNKEDGLNTNGILAIYKDQKNRFWFGGWGGLFRFDGKEFTSVTKDGPWE